MNKKILFSIISVIVIYLLISLINMGTVLLLFTTVMIPSWELKIIVQVFLIGVTSYGIGKSVHKILRDRAFVISIISLTMLCIVALLNLYMGVSIEPQWYTAFYIPNLLAGYITGYRSIKSK